MKKLLFVMCFLCAYFSMEAQLNMRLLDKIEYSEDLNDVWGWKHPGTGVEYAIVGLRNGVSIVSLADPENITEVAFIPGPRSTWRDIKTWGYYAYVTNETSNGVLVINMTNLPVAVDHFDWQPQISAFGGQLNTCHNLYIDEYGYCYLAGCNLNNGGVIYVDVFSKPGQPEVVGWGPSFYSHDVYARDNRLYSSEIYRGRFAVYDVTDKANPEFLAGHKTTADFTHNTWLSDDGMTIFTTDERPNAPVGAYDISDLDNIRLLDDFRPVLTLDDGVIPHNVHVWQDWLIISYYTDGGIVVDASRPSNLIEVGNFDSFFGNEGGFNGAWGAYPFLPSGIVLISDINSGLYVLAPNYVRACWLEGVVTEEGTGKLLQDVDVKINSAQANFTNTDVNGKYQTGQALAGTFEVTFTKQRYEPKTVRVDLSNGELTILNVSLKPLNLLTLSGLILDESTDLPVAGAEIFIENSDTTFTRTTSADGRISITDYFYGNQEIIVGKWGYHESSFNVAINGNTSFTQKLKPGYKDDFIFDLGWSSTADSRASSGFWERGKPVATIFDNETYNPGEDLPGDFGDQCYVTGNGGGDAGSDDVDSGSVFLESPKMDLTGYEKPVLTFYSWFANGGGTQGSGNINDTLTISCSNGSDTVVLKKIAGNQPEWKKSEIRLSDFLDITSDMKVVFETSDQTNRGHLVEAAVDGFLVRDEAATSTDNFVPELFKMAVYPNPASSFFYIEYELPINTETAELKVFNGLGQLVHAEKLDRQNGLTAIGRNFQKGVYFAKITTQNGAQKVIKLIKN